MGGELTGATAGRSGAPIRVGIAGSTGSIGTQTLDVVRAENARCPGSYEVTSLGAGRSVADVVAQAKEFSPDGRRRHGPAGTRARLRRRSRR